MAVDSTDTIFIRTGISSHLVINFQRLSMCLKKDCYWGHYLKLSPPVLHLSKTSQKTLPCYHCPPEKEKPQTLISTKAAHLFRNHLVTL